MAVLNVINTSGDKVSEVELTPEIFEIPVKSSVLHEVVKMQLAGKRAGTACVKNRSDVKGSTRKLFRQKGTGRARRGDIKAPLLRGGGVIFGPHPRSYAIRVPKKVKRLALKMALSSKLASDSIKVVDKIEMDAVKTKSFVEIMKTLDVRNALFVIDAKNDNVELSSRNIPKVKVLRADGLNVYDILKYDNLVLLSPSIESIEGRLKK